MLLFSGASPGPLLGTDHARTYLSGGSYFFAGEALDLIPELGGLFKFQLPCGLLHLLLQQSDALLTLSHIFFKDRGFGFMGDHQSVRHFFDDGFGHDAVLSVIGHLYAPAAFRFFHGPCHGGGYGIGVEDDPGFGISCGPADGLYKGGLRTQEAFLIRIQNGDQSHLRQVQSLPQQIDAHQHVKVSQPQIPNDLHAVQCIDIAVHIPDPDSHALQIFRQVLRHAFGQGGDQGTRALINNLYGGTFTDADHTKYTADSAENVKAIQALVDSKAIGFDASIAGGDEINLFRQGVLNVAFCWNIAQQLNADNNDAGLTNDGDEILFMAFPSEKATDTKLCGGIWGFGVFDNGDANKIEASKLFIKYMADSAEGTPDAVLSSTYFPVRDTVEGKDLTGLYGDVQTMSDYSTLMQYLGDYYQVTPGWAEARTAWWNMLQQVGSGADVQTAVDEFVGTANATAGN